MSCQEIETKFLDYLEHQLPPAERQAVEEHLGGCPGCRAFVHDLQQLDATLARSIQPPMLSGGFERRLQDRIQTMPAVLSKAHLAERKRQLEAEYEAGRVRLIRGSFALSGVFQHLTNPVLAALAVWLVWLFGPQLTALLKGWGLSDPGRKLVGLLVGSLIFLGLGLAEALPRRRKSVGP